ncbi:MAG TPA: transglutaminase-like domain-containing protein [Labilithrix sp.]|jgi:regulator of sirC expression with transglutaminase-like and TPR domain
MAILSFEELARMPDDAIDVAVGAMLVAKDVMEELDVDAALARLDALAGPLAGGALAGQDARAQASAVSARFRELGFEGNTTDYYDPKNSLLPEVIERKIGIPITLSVVWCEIARRAGVQARGVAFPGHFLVRVDARGAAPTTQPVIVDAFAGGRLVDDDVARDLLRRAIGDGADVHPALFTPATPRVVLVRMLSNLKAIWASRGEHARAFVAIDRIVTLVPDSARMLRERAAVALKLGATDLARTDIARVIDLEPEAPDVPALKKRLADLASTKTTFN